MNNQGQGVKLTAGDMLRAYWNDACAADWHLIPDCPEDFMEQMEGAGLAYCRPVEDEDLEQAFAFELGIESGGFVWDLTPAGRAALEQPQ
jgi:hypothetical protein